MLLRVIRLRCRSSHRINYSQRSLKAKILYGIHGKKCFKKVRKHFLRHRGIQSRNCMRKISNPLKNASLYTRSSSRVLKQVVLAHTDETLKVARLRFATRKCALRQAEITNSRPTRANTPA